MQTAACDSQNNTQVPIIDHSPMPIIDTMPHYFCSRYHARKELKRIHRRCMLTIAIRVKRRGRGKVHSRSQPNKYPPTAPTNQPKRQWCTYLCCILNYIMYTIETQDTQAHKQLPPADEILGCPKEISTNSSWRTGQTGSRRTVLEMWTLVLQLKKKRRRASLSRRTRSRWASWT